MISRRITKEVKIGNVTIGGQNKIAVQTMSNVKTADVDAAIAQINRVAQAGCDICRVAVFDSFDCKALPTIVANSSLPIVADIHFNANFAISAIESGVAKIRVNPGNFPQKRLLDIIDCAKMHNIAIRIGVNGGSVDKNLLEECQNKTLALAQSMRNMIDVFAKRGFENLVLSAKSSSVIETVKLNQQLSHDFAYPLHIGLTEAGLPQTGIVRNTMAISQLLSVGIGDTIRVSLTGTPQDEVLVAKNILAECGYAQQMVKFISCPKCGRCQIDLENVASEIYDYVKYINLPITIAVMGCEVNGPGECADADLGLAGGETVTFFKKGVIYKRVKKEDAVQEFKQEIDRFISYDK